MAIAFQFAHCDWYSRAGAPKRQAARTSSHGTERARGWSTAEILAEATRQPGHCFHVPNPAPPTVSYGSIEMVELALDAFIENQAVAVTLKSGKATVRKARSDSPSMAAGVISLPRDRLAEWPAFRAYAIHQLQERHGDRLRCVLEHLDEAHPHIHFYLVAHPGESFGVVHDGYAASRRARGEPGNKIRSTYNAAMSAWQDWVHEAICRPFALARLGPGRSRLSRRAWKQDEIRRLEERQRAVTNREVKAYADGVAGEKATRLLELREADLADREAAVAANRAKADKLLYDLDRRQKQLDIEQKINRAKSAELIINIEADAKTRAELRRLYASLTDHQRAAAEAEVPNMAEVLTAERRPTSRSLLR
jgi:hypothetical protein